MIEIRHNEMDNTSATQSAYNDLYSHRSLAHLDSYYLWLLSLLNAQKNGLLLDISTGEGRLVQLARQKGLLAIGIDFSLTGILIANRREPEAKWVVGDGEQLPFEDASFDYITNIGSLEHFQNPDAGMREISRLIKQNGTACILLPNTFSLFGNILYNAKTGYVSDDGQPLQRYHTPMGWRDMLVKNGLKPYDILGYELVFPRVWKDYFWYLQNPKKIIRKLISVFIPKNLSNCLVYLCRKDSPQ